jgi:hypothetical protein
MMSSLASIPSLPAIPISTTGLKWLPEEHWHAENFAAFSAQRNAHPDSLLKGPKLCHDKKQPSGFIGGRLLLFQNNTPIGWAEIHSYHHRYRNDYLIVDLNCDKISEDVWQGSLGSLMTALFFCRRSDQIKLILLCAIPSTMEATLQLWGEPFTIWTLTGIPPFMRHNQAPPLKPRKGWSIARGPWLQKQKTQSYFRKLEYLEQRNVRQEKMEAFNRSVKKPKRGFLSRLFRPRLDDSLF